MVAHNSAYSAITPFHRSIPAVAPVTAPLPVPEASDIAPATADHQEPQVLATVEWLFAASIFLVSGPVFIEAPLVRWMPALCTALTLALVMGGAWLLDRQRWQIWGSLLVGFSWSWLAGSLYWGWLRWEPTVHLPMEAIALPMALIAVRSRWGRIGSFFYLGSLLGTAITDSYFYLVDLMPCWRQAIAAESNSLQAVAPILHAALDKMYTPWGLGWAALLAGSLLLAGLATGWQAKRSGDLAWAVFSAALLGTLFVDGLFWVSALLA